MSAIAPTQVTSTPEAVTQHAESLLHEHQTTIWRRTDRLFVGLMVFEWIGGIVLASWLTPRIWEGATSSIHPHVWQALFLGGLIPVLPIFLVITRPAQAITRHCIAVSQMLIAALLIHLGGGRIEMHFQIFGSLAFLAFYRDWRVLITASAVAAADHLLRNLFMPQSIYGVSVASNWRWLEHAGWVVFEDIFLIAACRQGVTEMRGIAEHRALLEHSYRTVEEKVRERTLQLRQAQDELLKVARSAGMAEIATSVLHNVGNVLNSMNVSVSVATTKVKASPVGDLARAIGMLGEHKSDLADFITQDARGRMIPEFLEAVSETLSADHMQVLSEMQSLAKNVTHIQQIVSVQQSHAKASGPQEQVRFEELFEDAINVSLTASSIPITVERQFSETPPILVDKHTILQILINLMANAKHAVGACESSEKKITLRTGTETRDGAEWIRVQVSDNGVGIAQDHLTRIFNHGFTTKKDGHGFGLHSCANSAKSLGGSLSAQSEGPGKGATFTLELPIKKDMVPV